MNPSNKQVEFRFDFGAILALEEKGINIMDGGIKEEDLRKMKTYMLLVWAGLLYANPDITEKQARELVKGMTPKEVIEQVSSALKDAVVNDDVKPEKENSTTAS